MGSANVFESMIENVGKIPGMRIEREAYLKNCFKNMSELQRIINEGPIKAGVSVKEVGRLAKKAINYECNTATMTSFVTGIPGGIFMAGTIPADVLQFYGHAFTIVQKLMYLYGWEEDIFDKRGEIDDATKAMVTLYLGMMCGVKTASVALVKMATASTSKIVKGAIGKATIQGVIKGGAMRTAIIKIFKTMGIRATVKGGLKAWGKIVPIIGGVFSATVTMATFKPMAYRLKKYLETGEVEGIENDTDD